MSVPVFQITSLTVTAGSRKLLSGLSFDIPPGGGVFGLIGPSGAGKSTLIRCVNLLERPSTGTVFIDDEDLTAMSSRQLRFARRKIGMIFQNFNLLQRKNPTR